MMNDIDYNDSSSDDNESNEELFTPGRGRRHSLVYDFTPTPSRSDTSATPANNKPSTFFASSSKKEADPLPKLQDTSWLGARMSPIPSSHGLEDEDDAVVAPYRLGLSESASSAESVVVAAIDYEESQQPQQTGFGTIHGASRGYIRPRPPVLLHPHTTARTAKTNMFGAVREPPTQTRARRRPRRFLKNPFRIFWAAWTTAPNDDFPDDVDSSYVMVDGPTRARQRMRSNRRNGLVIGTTGLVLFCVGIHDGFLAYLAMRRGLASSYPLAWSLPWIGPSGRSLLRFGAFCPALQQYWRSTTSLVLATSVVEWVLLLWVWTMYLPSSAASLDGNHSMKLWWPLVYVMSAVTGQLWMTAYYHDNSNSNNYLGDADRLPALSGCAGWATAGVLCAVGIQTPYRRFPCFLSAIGFVVIHELETTGSVVGCAAAAFFGWAFAGTLFSSRDEKDRRKLWQQQHDLLTLGYTYHEAPNSNTAKRQSTRELLLRGLAVGVVLLLWLLPILFLLYR